MTSYADDNYIIETDEKLEIAIAKVKMKAEAAIDWLTNAGMRVNTAKTEFCIFHHKDITLQSVVLNDVLVKSKKEIKVLGVFFDSKLTWSFHASLCS